MPKSLAEEQFEIKHTNEVEMAKRELSRRALDTIRVFNPLDTPFRFMYDRYWHIIPPKSEKDLDRYLAAHFFKKICDYMIGQQIMKEGEELKALREKQFGHQYLDKYEENTEIWDRTPRLDDPDLIQAVKKLVIIGVVEEYGMDEPEPEERAPEAVLDYRPTHEKIFGDIDKMENQIPQTPPQKPAIASSDMPVTPRTSELPIDTDILMGKKMVQVPDPQTPQVQTKSEKPSSEEITNA